MEDAEDIPDEMMYDSNRFFNFCGIINLEYLYKIQYMK